MIPSLVSGGKRRFDFDDVEGSVFAFVELAEVFLVDLFAEGAAFLFGEFCGDAEALVSRSAEASPFFAAA